MFLNCSNSVKQLEFAIRELKIKGRPTDCLEEKLKRLKARAPNPKTRIDLHELFTKQAEEPIFYLYCSVFEVWCLQNHGRVPEYGTKLYKMRKKSFDQEQKL